MVLIAKLSPLTSHHIALCGAVCVFVHVSVSLMEDVVSVPLEESTQWEKMSKLELFSVITQIYRWMDCMLELCRIEPSAEVAEVHKLNTQVKV